MELYIPIGFMIPTMFAATRKYFISGPTHGDGPTHSDGTYARWWVLYTLFLCIIDRFLTGLNTPKCWSPLCLSACWRLLHLLYIFHPFFNETLWCTYARWCTSHGHYLILKTHRFKNIRTNFYISSIQRC